MPSSKEPVAGTSKSFLKSLKRSRYEPDSESGLVLVPNVPTVNAPQGCFLHDDNVLEEDEERIERSNVDINPSTEALAAQRQKEKHKLNPPASSSVPVPLVNFFSFGNPTVPLPVVTPLLYTAADVGAPPPKIPKKAHYNSHDPEEETKYIADNVLQQEKAIPGHQVESDGSEEESNFQIRAERYFKKNIVYSQYNFKYRKIDTSRLAACAKREMILDAIESNRVVIVEGFTGCGKTTQVPQFILDKYVATNRPCNIIVTQPRRIAAISVAQRVCRERGWEVGTVVGYQVGMEKRCDSDSTILTFVTTGVLLQKLIGERTVQDFTHIIIDEVHERDLESDLLLLIIKKILQDDEHGKEKHVKLILMSATLDTQKFSKYFTSRLNDFDDVVQSPVIKIPPTIRHRIDEYYLEHLVKDGLLNKDTLERINLKLRQKAAMLDEVYHSAVDLIVYFDKLESRRFSQDPRRPTVAMPENRGSVLVFLPGMEEINHLLQLLSEKNRRRLTETREEFKWDICKLHSSVTHDDQQNVFQRPPKGRRKIILSTNIAESSVTVPDVVYVIDFCTTKSMCVDPETNFTTLKLVWASVSQCIQRKGRTGRVADGKVYRLVPKRFFMELDQDTAPEMLRSNLETVILQLKKLNLGSPKELLALALNAPLLSGIERAVANLKECGALTIFSTDPKSKQRMYNACDGDITFLGQVMTELPISQKCARLIMLGHCFGVMKETIIIAACLSVKNPFSTPRQKRLDSYMSKMNWSKKSHSDCFCLLHVYKDWITKFGDTGESQHQRRAREYEKRWARGAYIELSAMREIKSTVELIEKRLKHRLKIIPQPLVNVEKTDGTLTREQSLMIKVAIAGAFYPNYFHRQSPDMTIYEKECSKQVFGNDLFNTVILRGFPPKHNGKLYAKHIANYLAYGLTIPVIKFEGQNVLALFGNQGDKIGPFNKGVYRAVKKQQIRENCEFHVVRPDKEAEELEKWTLSRDRRHFTTAPRQIELPPITVQSVGVFVTHMLTPSHFWVVYSERYAHLNRMVKEINDELCHIPLPKRKIVPNAFCLAPDEDKLYYRGKILTVDTLQGEALIYFVDYGNSSWTKTSALVDFSPSMVDKNFPTFPAVAVECRLAKVKPAIVYGSVWHEDAIKQFRDLTDREGATLKMEVYSVVKSVIVGTLKVAKQRQSSDLQQYDSDRFININEHLIEKRFADRMPETYLSELNHSVRCRVDIMKSNVEEVKAHNDDQIAETYDLDCIDPPKRGTDRVCLKGPCSPLELKFQNLCSSSSSKQVTIETNSVNSVVLDYEPTSPTSRLLVAAHVSVQERSGGLVARDTTIMPALPGLIALMSMLFSPKIELRTNMRKSRYSGVLCGLGTSPGKPEDPIYPDHDVEIVFDTEIDENDITEINGIRYFMNLILRQDYGKVNVSHTHKELMRKIILLLSKHRNQVDEEIGPKEEYVWNILNPDDMKTPSKEYFHYRHLDIFLPHNSVKLNGEIEDNLHWGLDV